MTPNQKAFLDMIAVSEIGQPLLDVTDNGYNVLVGSTVHNIMVFHSYDDHPRILNEALNSTAAGRYQLLAHWFDAYRNLLNLKDFSPASQDAIALQQIKERKALDDIEAGNIADAIAKVHNIWASLPGAGYGQHENNLDALLTAYTNAGGTLA